MRDRGKRARDQQSGAVLIIVLLVMVTLLGLGVMTLWLTNANLQVGGTMNQRTQALYVAEAGIERARAVLNGATAPALPTLLSGSTTGSDDVPTSVDVTTGLPNGVGAIMKDGTVALQNITFPPATFGRSAGTANAPTAATMGRYTVWIRNDLAELRQGMMTTDTNQAVVLRARGVASDGRTNVILEVTMVPSTLVGASPGTSGALITGDCVAGKNACDDNSSTQYGIVYAGS